MAADCAEFAFNLLKTTQAVTDLVVGGADSVLESGYLDAKWLDEAEEKRREDGTPNLALCVCVTDAGEEVEHEKQHRQRVRVWIYDRGGWANIRAIRKQVYLALQGKKSKLDSPLTNRTRMDAFLYQGCTGHRVEHRLAALYVYLTFEAIVGLDPG